MLHYSVCHFTTDLEEIIQKKKRDHLNFIHKVAKSSFLPSADTL
jgi:hypothetical protein